MHALTHVALVQRSELRGAQRRHDRGRHVAPISPFASANSTSSARVWSCNIFQKLQLPEAPDDHRRVLLTSNIGHLLWSGIVDDERADEVAARLSEERLFSGWGVRTMAEGDGGYNPIGYHQGTVWPHDNSLIAAGLRRYGHDEQAATIAFAILEAAQYFLGRLPETFAGYPRSLTQYPVEYPTACSPQAWATGAPLFLLRVLLGIEAQDGATSQNPVLPKQIGELALRNLPGRAEPVAHRLEYGSD
jgi:glycogen debranching enzyme